MKYVLVLCLLTACATGGAAPDNAAPAFLVAAQGPPPAERTAMQVAPVALGAPVTEVRQFVTFGADGHVRSVCTVVFRMDGSRLYLPFPDSTLVLPSSDRARC